MESVMTKNTLTNLIEKSQELIKDEPRDYIGASSIGSDCLRQIWYAFKGFEAEEVPTKMRRTWAIGRHLEGLILDWIEDCGISISRYWGDLEDSDFTFFQGHIDSMWMKKDDAFAIIEVKTAKDSSFKLFVKNGVKKWNPQYYAQIQSYMGMSGVFNTYIVVLNKDNSELSDELIEYDSGFYERLREKARIVYDAVIEPPRIHHSPIWYQCKMCKYNKVCHK